MDIFTEEQLKMTERLYTSEKGAFPYESFLAWAYILIILSYIVVRNRIIATEESLERAVSELYVLQDELFELKDKNILIPKLDLQREQMGKKRTRISSEVLEEDLFPSPISVARSTD